MTQRSVMILCERGVLFFRVVDRGEEVEDEVEQEDDVHHVFEGGLEGRDFFDEHGEVGHERHGIEHEEEEEEVPESEEERVRVDEEPELHLRFDLSRVLRDGEDALLNGLPAAEGDVVEVARGAVLLDVVQDAPELDHGEDRQDHALLALGQRLDLLHALHRGAEGAVQDVLFLVALARLALVVVVGRRHLELAALVAQVHRVVRGLLRAERLQVHVLGRLDFPGLHAWAQDVPLLVRLQQLFAVVVGVHAVRLVRAAELS